MAFRRRQFLSPQALWSPVMLMICSLASQGTHAQLIDGGFVPAPAPITFLPSSLEPAASPAGSLLQGGTNPLAAASAAAAPATEAPEKPPLVTAPLPPPPAKALPRSPPPVPALKTLPASVRPAEPEPAVLPSPVVSAPAPRRPAPVPPIIAPPIVPAPVAPAPEAAPVAAPVPPKLPSPLVAAQPQPAPAAEPALQPVVRPPVVPPQVVAPQAPKAEPASKPLAPAAVASPEVGPPPLAPPPRAPVPGVPAGQTYLPKGIIRVSAKTFVDDACREYTFSGWNQWYDALSEAIQTSSALKAQNIAGAAALTEENPVAQRFQDANAAGMNVFRLFGHGGDGDVPPLQPSPGVYNETVFRGLDYVLAQAAKHNLKVILSLSTFWNDKGDGQKAFARWAGVSQDDFWDSPKARALYNAHMKVMANRVNTFTGVKYKDDPTIMAWNLMNEPRFPADQAPNGDPDPAATLTRWYNYMAAELKSLDPKHMVTTGAEGFFKAGTPYTKYNPFGTPSNVRPGWAGNVGQDAFTQHASPNIDFVDMHLWPDNWSTLDPRFIPLWLDGHIKAAEALGKPLVLEEFGKIASQDPLNITKVRDPVFKVAYEATQASLAKNGPLKGALFWEWVADGGTPGDRGVKTTDTTWGLVRQNSAFVNNLSGRPVPGCVPPVPVIPPPDVPAAPIPAPAPAPATLPAEPLPAPAPAGRGELPAAGR